MNVHTCVFCVEQNSILVPQTKNRKIAVCYVWLFGILFWMWHNKLGRSLMFVSGIHWAHYLKEAFFSFSYMLLKQYGGPGVRWSCVHVCVGERWYCMHEASWAMDQLIKGPYLDFVPNQGPIFWKHFPSSRGWVSTSHPQRMVIPVHMLRELPSGDQLTPVGRSTYPATGVSWSSCMTHIFKSVVLTTHNVLYGQIPHKLTYILIHKYIGLFMRHLSI